MDNLVGQSLGQYTIRRALGRGGMASVYLAYHPQMNREVAIKVLPREFVNDEMFRVRFEREAQTIAALEHPAIVPVYDFGEMDGQPYLVMRYMPGGSLADRIAQGPVPLEIVVRIFERIASALDAAHNRGIIHRDIKPANILFDAYDEAYLSDFGIAKLAETTIELTGTGIVGTPAYIAPEMASPGGVQPLIDIYALGVTLFQALTGTLPYQADTPMGLLMAHMSQPVPDITTLRPDLPERIQHVIEQSLAKDPTTRYQSALNMVADLETAVTLIDQPRPEPPGGADDTEATLLEHSPAFVEAAEQPASARTMLDAPAAGPRSAPEPPLAPPLAPPAAAPRKARVPAGVWIAGGLVGVVLCVGLAAGGLALLAPGKQATPTPEPDATGGALAEVTGEPPGEAADAPTAAPTITPIPELTLIPTSPYPPPVEVQPYCSFVGEPTVVVEAGHPVMLAWSWTTTRPDLIQDHLEAAIYSIMLDGSPVEAVRRSDIYTNDQGYYVITWYAEPVILSPGTHIAARGLSWTRQISDGWETFGPGGQIETEYDECTIIVR